MPIERFTAWSAWRDISILGQLIAAIVMVATDGLPILIGNPKAACELSWLEEMCVQVA